MLEEDSVIELRDDLGVIGVFSLTYENMPSRGRRRDAVAYLRERGEAVYVKEVLDAFGIHKTCKSRRSLTPIRCPFFLGKISPQRSTG